MTEYTPTDYESKIYDGARDLAVAHRDEPMAMFHALEDLGAPPEDCHEVMQAMLSSGYRETLYRGAMCDEAVIEALKAALRAVHGYGESDAAYCSHQGDTERKMGGVICADCRILLTQAELEERFTARICEVVA
jgi:hypothetical protein